MYPSPIQTRQSKADCLQPKECVPLPDILPVQTATEEYSSEKRAQTRELIFSSLILKIKINETDLFLLIYQNKTEKLTWLIFDVAPNF